MTGALRLPTVVIRPRTVEVTGREAWMQALTRNFEEPDKTTRFPNGYEHVIDVLGTPVGWPRSSRGGVGPTTSVR